MSFIIVPGESDCDIVQITDHLYLGNWNTACNVDFIKPYNFKAIMCISEHQKPNFVLEQYKEHNITHYYKFLYDNTKERISQLNSFIDPICQHIKNKENVFVHCMSGMSRSPCFILMVLRQLALENGEQNNWDLLNKHFDLLKQKRSIVRINEGFFEQIKQLYI
jgi:protein tyrosine phosphatase